jgi:hypothetical protein
VTARRNRAARRVRRERDLIHAIGSKVYTRGRRGHYDLVNAISMRRASPFQRRSKPAKLSTCGKCLKAGEDHAFECAQA